MMIVMRADASQDQISAVVARVEGQGLKAHLSRGAERTVIGVVGDSRLIVKDHFIRMPGVAHTEPCSADKLGSARAPSSSRH